MVDVEGTFYRRHRVDLRPAERDASERTPEQHSVQHSSPTEGQPGGPPGNTMDINNDAGTGVQEVRPHRRSDWLAPPTPPPPVPGHRTDSGRLGKVTNRLDL